MVLLRTGNENKSRCYDRRFMVTVNSLAFVCLRERERRGGVWGGGWGGGGRGGGGL